MFVFYLKAIFIMFQYTFFFIFSSYLIQCIKIRVALTLGRSDFKRTCSITCLAHRHLYLNFHVKLLTRRYW